MPIADELAVGDLFVVRPGEKIATDGVVVEGELGGRPVDAHRRARAGRRRARGPTSPGATINTYGRLVVRATKVGEETALAQIARLVAEAQSGKAPIQRLVDRVSGVFVPIVLALSLATLAGWLARHGRCDGCVLRRSRRPDHRVPVRARASRRRPRSWSEPGRGAQLGILIKGPEVLERTRRITTIVLDKTGTVTEGKMELADVTPLDGAAATTSCASPARSRPRPSIRSRRR